MNRQVFVIGLMVFLLCGIHSYVHASGGDHLYAVLINGGRNRLTNHERYWNDCAFLYRTLRNTYRVPKRNITVLMSDGGTIGEDMLRDDGRGFLSSPIDLDGDGQLDIDHPATQQVVTQVLVNLSRKLRTDDHLFIFVMDHGGKNEQEDEPFIWLWSDEKLDAYSLASLLGLFRVASVNILMGQCYSGGFIPYLKEEGLIIATACSGNEQSWVCPDRPYDEFVYHWTCAMNGADELGNPVHADSDGNGQVSMAEAFHYAKEHDRVYETPQYASWPESLGEQWTIASSLSGELGVHEIKTSDEPPSAIWTLSGQRSGSVNGHSVYIQREGGKIRKIVR